MTESTGPGPAVPDEDAAAAARLAEARKRKERREAKIRAGGSSRLNKISGLGGGLQRDETPPPPAPQAQPTTTTAHADPDEVDISEHFYQPTTTARLPVAATGDFDAMSSPLARMDPSGADAQLLELLAGRSQNSSSPFGPTAGMDGLPGDDPIAAMMAQMMQTMGGAGGAGGPGGPGFGGGVGSGWPPKQQKPAVPSAPAALWRLVHFAVAVALGLYVAVATPFAGTRAERERSQAAQAAANGIGGIDDYDSAHRRYFFYAFATAETVLLTSRFLVEGGAGGLRKKNGSGSSSKPSGGGLVSMALGFAPPVVRRTVDVGLRYWQIFSTVRSDLLVCVFVLGACSWVRA